MQCLHIMVDWDVVFNRVGPRSWFDMPHGENLPLIMIQSGKIKNSKVQ